MSDYLEKLLRLEPPIYPPYNAPEYRLTYYVPPLKKWHTHTHLCIWQVWYICVFCARTERPVRVYHIVADKIFGTEIALLNLFYNTLSDRKRETLESEKKEEKFILGCE